MLRSKELVRGDRIEHSNQRRSSHDVHRTYYQLAMRLLLIARSLIGFWFAMRFAGIQNPQWESIFDLLADYLLIDGVAGMVVAVAFLRASVAGKASREWKLGAVLLVDGVGRLGSGIAVHQFPGLPGFPVTAILFLGVMAACTAAVGITEAVLVVAEERARHGHHDRRPQFAAIPVGLAAIASIVFGVAAIRAVEDVTRLHTLLTEFIVAASATVLATALSRHVSAARKP